MRKDTSKQAFPWPPSYAGGEYESGNDGMTLREYYAGLAMQGILATCGQYVANDASRVARIAKQCADALLEELQK